MTLKRFIVGFVVCFPISAIVVTCTMKACHAAPRVGSSLDATTNAPILITTTDIAPTNAFLAAVATSPPAALPIETPLTGPTNEPPGFSVISLTNFSTMETNSWFALCDTNGTLFEVRVTSTNFDAYPKQFTFSRTNQDVFTLTMLEGGALTNLVFHERPVVRCDGTNWLVDLDPSAKPVRDDPNATNAIATSAFASGFSQGIRYSLLAATRNPDVHDARILAMIAVELWKKGNP